MAEPALAATFRRPFPEQVAAWRLRLQELRPSYAWDQYEPEANQRAFMVAGATKAELLADLAAAVDRAIVEGTGIEAFRRDFREITDRLGWPGKAGQGSARGFAWRTRVIYRTNMRTSYMSGRHTQLVAGDFKFWVYRHSGAAEPRLQHLGWNGLALAPDHPFWATHFPPNGWGCGCEVYGARTEAGIRRVGGDPGKAPPEGWAAPDPRTGAPKGIDRGWDYSVGAGVTDLVRSLAARTVSWPYEIANAYMQDVPPEVRDRLARAYRRSPEVATEVRRFAERSLGERNGAPITSALNPEPIRTLGPLTAAHRAEIERTVPDLAGYHFTLDASSVGHVKREHGPGTGEEKQGQIPVEPRHFALLPLVLDDPESIEDGGVSDQRLPIVRLTKRVGELVVTAAFEVRGRKRRMLALKSMWLRPASAGASP